MKAQELAELLLTVPDAEVRLESILVGKAPDLLERSRVVMNAEANCWILVTRPAFETTTPTLGPALAAAAAKSVLPIPKYCPHGIAIAFCPTCSPYGKIPGSGMPASPLENAPPPNPNDHRLVRCLKCQEQFYLNESHVCPR